MNESICKLGAGDFSVGIDVETLKNRADFALYFQLLTEWNARFNLTAITDRDDVFLKHFRDSLLPADLLPKGARLLDVGSGAGFPAVCLKLFRPDLDVTLLDSVGKKVSFLQELIERLSLKGIVAIKSRIEEFALRDFDIVTARAVAGCSVLAEYCLPFLRLGGQVILYKSVDIEQELLAAQTAIKRLGGGDVRIENRPLDAQTMRTFVIIKKVAETPKGFPRGGNKPRLSPL